MLSSRILFVICCLALLLLANLFMLTGFTNYPSEGFANYGLGGAPTGSGYVPIGTYDNVIKKPEHGLSNWRGPARKAEVANDRIDQIEKAIAEADPPEGRRRIVQVDRGMGF